MVDYGGGHIFPMLCNGPYFGDKKSWGFYFTTQKIRWFMCGVLKIEGYLM